MTFRLMSLHKTFPIYPTAYRNLYMDIPQKLPIKMSKATVFILSICQTLPLMTCFSSWPPAQCLNHVDSIPEVSLRFILLFLSHYYCHCDFLRSCGSNDSCLGLVVYYLFAVLPG